MIQRNFGASLRWLICLVGLGIAFTSIGCATIRANRARTAYLTEQLSALRYEGSIDEIWLAVRRLLAENEFPMIGTDAKAVGQSTSILDMFSRAHETRGDENSRLLETGLKDRRRQRAEAFRDENGYRIVFTRIEAKNGETMAEEESRSLDLELELARRLAPEKAAKIDEGLAAIGAK